MKQHGWNRLTAFFLCFALLTALFPATGLVSTAAEDLIVYVGDENTNLYAENYSAYLTASAGAARTFRGYAWRGDQVLSRVDLLTRKPYTAVTLSAGDFVTEDGRRIASENVSFTYLDAVRVTEKNQTLFDIISSDTVRDLDAKQVYGAWVIITVPESAQAGVYHGTLSVASGDATLAELDYTIEVFDLVQPEITSDVDLWMWPYNSIRYYSGKTTEELYGQTEMGDVDPELLYNAHLDEKYFPALESELELYAKAGGSAVFAQVSEKNRTNGDPYPSLVKWIRHKDGTMSFDYKDFDQWVELNMKHGIDKEIKCYDMGVFWNNITFYDEGQGRVVEQHDSTGGQIWTRFWTMFLEDFIVHLEGKGWFDITYMALDEKDYNITKNVIDLVKSVKNEDGKSLKIATAVATFDCEELFDSIDDLSLAYGLSGGHLVSVAQDRKEKGLITTIYTCGPQGSSMLNTPGESAESIHVTYKEDTTGFLRWALQKYNAEPYEQSVNYNTTLCAGDCYLIYPDTRDGKMQARSTPRYEKLCEGLRDIEKAWYLEENLPELANELHDALLETQKQPDFRAAIEIYSRRLATGDYPRFALTSDTFQLPYGRTHLLALSESGQQVVRQQAKQTYIDDFNFTYSDGWKGEGQYFWLFLYSTNHYSTANSNAEAQSKLFYEFDFYGDSLRIMGSTGREYGQGLVYIDDVLAGSLEAYSENGGMYQMLYQSDRLGSGEHHVKVIGAGTKAPGAASYKMQVDYAVATVTVPVVWSSANPKIATVSQDGTVHGVGVGQTTITATCGDVSTTVVVNVNANKAAIDELIAEYEKIDLSGYPEETSAAFRKRMEDARTAANNEDATAEELNAAYQALKDAKYILIDKITLKFRPIMLTFVQGETFSAAGGVLSVLYLDGSEELIPLTEDMASGYDTSIVGEQTVTVSCYERTLTYQITVTAPGDPCKTFKDVVEGKWYVEAVAYAVQHNLFNGISTTEFKPNTAMNRAMLVSVLYRMEGSPSAAGMSNPFDDVPEGKYYTEAVLWASSNNIVNGIREGTFAPMNNITREQMATILYRYSGLRGLDTGKSANLYRFPDASDTSAYAQEALAWANAEELITGTQAGDRVLLNPKGNATRAQVATILMRFQQNIVK